MYVCTYIHTYIQMYIEKKDELKIVCNLYIFDIT